MDPAGSPRRRQAWAKRAGLLAALLLATGVFVAAATAGGTDDPQAPPPAVKWAKLSSDLAQVLRAERQNGRGLAVARSRGLQVVGTRIRVVVEARTTRAGVTSAVLAGNGKVEAWHAGLLQALVAPAALARLTTAAAVDYIRAPRRPVTLESRASPAAAS